MGAELTDPHDPIGVAKPQGWFWWLGGRASRREYWVYVGLLILLSLVLRYAPPIVGLVFNMVLIFVQIRRLHDFGRSGWWAAAAMLASLVPAAPLVFLAGEGVAILVGTAIALVLIVLIGALRGDVGDNRFGPPPLFTVRRVFTGR